MDTRTCGRDKMNKFIEKSFHLFSVIGVFGILSIAATTGATKEVRIQHGALTLNGVLNLIDGKPLKKDIVLMGHGTLAHNGMDTIKNLASVLNERGFSTLAINLSLGIDDREGMYDCETPHRHKHTDSLEEIRMQV